MDEAPVSHSVREYRLADLPSGPLCTTVHRYEGGRGPTVYVQAGQHGIELNGVAAARRLHERLVDARLAGTVVLVPVANPLALDHRSYMTPAAIDALEPNLNRVWPGDGDGTVVERAAARLWDLARDVDAVVDLHTGIASMLGHVRYRRDDERSRALAEAFGMEYLLADSTDGSTGTLRAVAADHDVPAITVELGDSRTVSSAAVDEGERGLLGTLGHLGVVAVDPTPSTAFTTLLDDQPPVRATTSGLCELRGDLTVGDRVEADEDLGVVYDPSTFDRRETITAARSGVLYSASREATTIEGEPVARVASLLS